MRLIGVVGWKNSGKTGLVERLVAHFTAAGLRVSTLKHTHHGVDLETPGTDTHRHREAGAGQVMLASDRHTTLMTQLSAPETVEALAARLDPCDLVISEGWKRGSHPRIEAHRTETGKALLALEDAGILAVASNASPDAPCPVLDLNDTGAIADFILREVPDVA